MKILVIFTGGTIGSTESNGWISTDPATDYRLINGYQSKWGHSAEFVTATPYTVLSENLTAGELCLLMDCICDGVKGDYDGIIVAHGTDTLQYSAAAAAFCVGCECIPVMFVSSNFPLGSDFSNGEINFEAAVAFIRGKAGRGVYACYANDASGCVDIHCAARMLRHPEFSDKIYSLGGSPYARYRDNMVKTCDDYIPSATGTPCGRVHFCDNPGLLTIHASPTEQYDYDLSKYRAILLIPYHSGTLNTASPQLEQLCSQARELNIPVFLPDVPCGDAYESMRAYQRLHIHILLGAASVPISVKIWIAISLGLDIALFVKTPMVQEFINPSIL